MARTSDGSTAIARTIRRLLRARGAGKTICPSEVARALAPDDWRRRMPAVRAEIVRLADRNEVMVMQRGAVVDPRTARGAIRIARAAASRP
jgi:hypothetical protein